MQPSNPPTCAPRFGYCTSRRTMSPARSCRVMQETLSFCTSTLSLDQIPEVQFCRSAIRAVRTCHDEMQREKEICRFMIGRHSLANVVCSINRGLEFELELPHS